MDNSKWKSITLNINDYHTIRGVSFYNYRKLSCTIKKLIDDYINNIAHEKNLNPKEFKLEMIKISELNKQ